MSKKRTPPPEPRTNYGCATIILVPSLLLVIATVYTRIWWPLVFCIPAFVIVGRWASEKWLLILALFLYKRRDVAGVLITSDSPNWSGYIQENWVARWGDQFVVLNWSQRRKLKSSIAVRLFYQFCSPQERNFCPAVIYLRGLRHPLVFRCFYAFRDYKHGDDAALRSIEHRLFQELQLDHESE